MVLCETLKNASSLLDFQGFEAAPLKKWPFVHFMVPHFVRPQFLGEIRRELPACDQGGSFPIASGYLKGHAQILLEALGSESFQAMVLSKLGQRPRPFLTQMTYRGYSRPTDGGVHTDQRSKIVTILLYLSPFEHVKNEEGQLHLLPDRDAPWSRSEKVPSWDGGMVAFLNAPHAWHGYPTFVGKREVLQINYMANRRAVFGTYLRHNLSALGKEIYRFIRPQRYKG